MKAKFRLLLFSVMLLILFPACGNDTKIIEGEVQMEETVDIKPDEKPLEQELKEQGKDEQAEGREKYKGYVFFYQDIPIEIDADAEPIIGQLGESNSYFEAASCAFDGIDKMYTYNSFEIDTYPKDNRDYISAVIFKDDAVTTAEGVGIGDSADKIKEVYGGDVVEGNGTLVYEKDKVKLIFILQDGIVVSIEYRSTVLDEG